MSPSAGPTQLEFSALRARGVIAYSSLTTACGALLGAAIGAYIVYDDVLHAGKVLWSASSFTQINSIPDVLPMVLSIPVAAACGACGIGLLQSRFLLSWGGGFRRERVTGGFWLRGTQSVVWSVVTLVSAVGAGVLALSLLGRYFNGGAIELRNAHVQLGGTCFIAVALLSVSIGVVAYVVQRWLFVTYFARKYNASEDSH